MSFGLEPLISERGDVVDRLVAAGVLAAGDDGLATTERWQGDLLEELMARPTDPLQDSFARTIGRTFPDVPEDERGLMARIMLLVEAREATS